MQPVIARGFACLPALLIAEYNCTSANVIVLLLSVRARPRAGVAYARNLFSERPGATDSRPFPPLTAHVF